ncbi:MAG: hypothetical protein NTW12_02135 [Deltaproteobacteria bacterium]|nr:hypothetical protein [Deltaproteobacteria bacterium]
MNDIDYQQIMKWILIVLVAGFIGQFGKSFATYLIERARKKKLLAASERLGGSVKQPGEATPTETMTETKEAQVKAEKKMLKSLIKLRKKEK